jgi:hypothetical protein
VNTIVLDNIINIDELRKLEPSEQRDLLLYWRNNYTNKEILKGMSISSVKFYDLVKEFNLPKAPRVDSGLPRKAHAKKPAKKKKAKTSVEINEQQEIQMPTLKDYATDESFLDKYAPPVQNIIYNGMNLSFTGTYKAEQIQKTLKKFSAMLEEENEDFYVEIKVMEKKPNENEDGGCPNCRSMLPF